MISSPGELTITDENLFNEIEDPLQIEDPRICNSVYCQSDVEEDSSDSETDVEDSSIEQESAYGLRMRCPLNSLSAFHAVFSFPPDMLHDILEGRLMLDIRCTFMVQEFHW